MTVRAKFTVQSKEAWGDGATINLLPVYSGSKENEEFYQYTPGGNISLSTINPAAAEQFEVGKSYYVDFVLAE